MKLPAGKYFIGDPCYVLQSKDNSDERWSKFCDLIYEDEDGNTNEVTEFEGVPMYTGNTKYGDGYYLDNYGNGYGVDAGLIGAVPMELCKQSKKEMDRLGRVVVFKKDFRARSQDGIFYFGDIVIDTAGDDEE